ncbi:hypothetical protein [Nonomuraea sp. SBT364]|uniref:hypothetical protein n=1 Tax=Nonomuraea sp. SBT364 TaxID=1580530 RepID=UPI001E5057BC|nr:hypothetical protein [Nonomuraea sp. SBT364]
MSHTVCARHSPADNAEGASSVTNKPTTHRLATSIAAVTYGRPIGSRCCSSTTSRSTDVWSICTCCSRPSMLGGSPPADRRRRAPSAPFRAVAAAAGSSASIRRSSVLRAGTGSPPVRHRRTTSR